MIQALGAGQVPSWWEIVLGVVALAAAAIAIRLSFDINKWMESRRKNKEERLRILCPHCYVVPAGHWYEVKTYFMSPRGTIQWGCSQCGFVVPDRSWVIETMNVWVNNVPGLIDRQEKFDKLARKLYKI